MELTWNEKVWRLISQIPCGKVVSYGQVAAMLDHPRRARQVGFALHQTPSQMNLPWHRVINSQGMISFPNPSERYFEQKVRLLEEGVHFDQRDRVDFQIFGWSPEQPWEM